MDPRSSETGPTDRGLVEERELLILYLIGLAVFFGVLLLLNL